MKVLVLLALVTVCAVGLTKAAPYSSLNALAKKEDVNQRALLQGFLSSMMGYLSKKEKTATDRGSALAQGFFSDVMGYLKEKVNEMKGSANAQGFLSDVMGYLKEKVNKMKGSADAQGFFSDVMGYLKKMMIEMKGSANAQGFSFPSSIVCIRAPCP